MCLCVCVIFVCVYVCVYVVVVGVGDQVEQINVLKFFFLAYSLCVQFSNVSS